MNMTSKFIKLGPCPHCGSSDARGEYADNYYCFSCSKYDKKSDTASLRERIKQRTKQHVANSIGLIDTVKEIPRTAMQWLLKYNITPAEIKTIWYCLVYEQTVTCLNTKHKLLASP